MTDDRPVPAGALPAGAPPADYPPGPPLAPPPSPVPPGTSGPAWGWAAASAPAPAPPDGGGSGRRAWFVAALVAVAVVALLAAAVAALGDGVDAGAGAGTGAIPPGAPLPPRPPATVPGPDRPAPGRGPAAGRGLEAAVADVRAFVEAERGLVFLAEVEVEVLDDTAFAARVDARLDERAGEWAATGRLLTALGLVEAVLDVAAAHRSLLRTGVPGFYDAGAGELVLREVAPTPYVRAVLARELTRALDDQYFDLDRRAPGPPGGEWPVGLAALAEGDAGRVEQAYRATFSPDEEAHALMEELAAGNRGGGGAVPGAVVELAGAAHGLGPPLVEAILADGGQDALDRAFEAPPTTSEQLLDPGRFLAGEDALPVPPVAVDGPVTGEGVLGAVVLSVLLGDSVLAGPPAIPAVQGWGGDRYVTYDGPGGRACVGAAVVGDTAAATLALAAALDRWAAEAPNGVTATVAPAADGSVVAFTSCSA